MTEERKPSRGIAVLLALLGPWGIGHVYLGQIRRGVLWLTVPTAAILVTTALISPIGHLVGFGLVLGALALGVVGTWFASVSDLQRVPTERLRRTSIWRVALYWFLGIVFTVVVRTAVKGGLLQSFNINYGAMSPTTLVGDRVFADKLVLRTRGPERGEVVVFADPEGPEQDFIFRIVTKPGDVLELKDGHPWINGWEVPHCLVGTASLEQRRGELFVEYLDGHAYLVFYDSNTDEQPAGHGPYEAGPDEYWVLGDNRNHSFDSRAWFHGKGGGVPSRNIRGRALFRWLTVTPETGIDWSRYGVPFSELLLPTAMKSLEGDVRRCLASRPSDEKTVPP